MFQTIKRTNKKKCSHFVLTCILGVTHAHERHKCVTSGIIKEEFIKAALLVETIEKNKKTNEFFSKKQNEHGI